MAGESKLYGLVVSGGKSTRMGRDKSMLVYYKKPQRYHAHELLATVCDRVFISCNREQLPGINKNYTALPDQPAYRQSGPMAALLTAFTQHPGSDLLILGCDYPFVGTNDVRNFYYSIKPDTTAAAFYDYEQHSYEPLLAWYSSKTAPLLMNMYKTRNYSLQNFLQSNNAQKYFPASSRTITSVDTPEAFAAALTLLKKKHRSM